MSASQKFGASYTDSSGGDDHAVTTQRGSGHTDAPLSPEERRRLVEKPFPALTIVGPTYVGAGRGALQSHYETIDSDRSTKRAQNR